jgi:hypothetical protein
MEYNNYNISNDECKKVTTSAYKNSIDRRFDYDFDHYTGIGDESVAYLSFKREAFVPRTKYDNIIWKLSSLDFLRNKK